MSNFDDIYSFSKIAELNSYTKAAKQLNIPKATLSRRIKNLEERMSVKLINRDTRKLSLTEAGIHLYKSSSYPLAQLREIENEASNFQTKPAGDLKITLPVEVSIRLLNDIISDFVMLHPQINLEIFFTNEVVDIINDGFDLAIRGGAPKDSNLISKKILSSKLHFCCSRTYFEEHQLLSHPNQISSQNFVTFDSPTSEHIKITRDSEEIILHTRNSLNVNSLDMVLQCALKGYGIAMLPTSVCYDALESGALIPLFKDWSTPEIALYALYPNRVKTNKLQLFIEYIEHRLRDIELKFKAFE
ncbi:LysR family transcriptional regulator [Amphritea sp.]|uniref:LysR family transcriptional regulator n=1 Tax=Amphritea sp. TaxID=1872502 RepID=UPI0025BDC6FA|nr:LysR family transcriptional regulator [Amphritea sp.]